MGLLFSGNIYRDISHPKLFAFHPKSIANPFLLYIIYIINVRVRRKFTTRIWFPIELWFKYFECDTRQGKIFIIAYILLTHI